MNDIEHETKMRAVERVMAGGALPMPEVGEVWRLKDHDPWTPMRYTIIDTIPGWVRLQVIAGGDDAYWITPRGMRVQVLYSMYERDREYEAQQASERG